SGRSVLAPGTAVPTDWRIVSPGFFRTMGIPLLRGRDLTDADGPTASVTVVSQATARRFWGDEDPIGRTVHATANPREPSVVGDIRSTALNQESPAVYFPSARSVWPLMDVIVRSEQDPLSLVPAVRQRVQALDPGLALATIRTMDDWVANTAAQPRLNAALL